MPYTTFNEGKYWYDITIVKRITNVLNILTNEYFSMRSLETIDCSGYLSTYVCSLKKSEFPAHWHNYNNKK